MWEIHINSSSKFFFNCKGFKMITFDFGLVELKEIREITIDVLHHG